MKRRLFARAAFISLGAGAAHAQKFRRRNVNDLLVYFGTYTRANKSVGLYLSRLNPQSGALTEPQVVATASNPSFIALHPSQQYLYAVNEDGNFAGKKQGAVTAFAINGDGTLRALNQQPTGGSAPCHLSVEATGKYLLSANYGGGNCIVHPINDDGSLRAATDFVQHVGKGTTARQQAPHAHSIMLAPDNRFAFAADLGLDKVLIYQLDLTTGKLKPHGEASIKAGAGPRHFDFHPTGKFAYCINELDETMTAFSYDTKAGRLTEVQHITTLPADFKGQSYCADVHVHPNGKFVYGSNRGHDSIAIFAIDQRTGKLTVVGHESTQGKNPRNFGIDPTGRWLLAANMDSDNVVVFRIDEATGKLTPTGRPIAAWTPVCVKFVARTGR